MTQKYRAKLLRIHFSESDRFQGKPLWEAIVAKCREMNIAGATVFRGLEGYGESAELHKAHLIRHDQPVVVVVVDTAERLSALIPAIENMMDTGLIAASDVEVTRVQKSVGPAGGSETGQRGP